MDLRNFFSMTHNEPNVSPTGRYNVKETCEVLGISPNTLKKYNKSLAIRCGVRKATGMKYYCGKDIIAFWHNSY